MHPSTSCPDPGRRIGTEDPKDVIDLEHIEEEEKAIGCIEDARAVAGDAHFHRLGWKRLTVVLIVQSIALGTLSIPSAFASLGMVAGVVITVALGLLAIYASYIVGLLKLKYPHIPHYADFGRLLLGSPGDWLFSSIFVAQLTLVVGSHCVTGKLALAAISDSAVCSLILGAISAVILFMLAIPPSFAELAVLGYIDFASIAIAVGIAIIATGLQRDEIVALPWSAWPKDNLTLGEAFVAISTIVFAYAFAAAQPSFMDEMHSPQDFGSSIFVLGTVQITVYTVTGALIYAFVGQTVQSPALLSIGPLLSKVSFGIALPVIFISGSINTTVACRFMHGRVFQHSITRYVNTAAGWATWLGLVAALTVLSWVISEAIPFFSELLSLSGCLFVSGFSFYLPPLLWFFLLKEGSCFEKQNFQSAVLNLLVFAVGVCVLGFGTYASVKQIMVQFEAGSVGRPFSCSSG
ncbi:uncharacterized protein APUU_71233A [Aspergillus puulaauensis]|uniref:Amino acid transporter transmembrane domain-containing protein n=1 Tax=Aspergillus puulaauensis TaxID=1220207 RepID=A0A7R8AU88_9EURO|nr:uncharacterized protein APUU_71233A [Aspergillus puulaauensis]BCS29663.1 hypothetical protein APUU_71233A [Aspergillus puulaauensis]